MSYVRVVRFTGVDPDRIADLKERVAENEGPPEGVPATALRVLHDTEQGTAVVLQSFDSMDDLKAGEEVLSAMDAGDTPGTRESVDRCEVTIDVSA
jgi:hypothetical protein